MSLGTRMGRIFRHAPAPISFSLKPDHRRASQRRVRAGRALLAFSLTVLAALLLGPGPSSVTGDERNIEQYAVKRVQPVYPPLAQKQRIEGIVVVQLTVAGTGKVTAAEFLRGNNIFKTASIEAAKRWEFKVPNGDSLEGTIRFAFKLEG